MEMIRARENSNGVVQVQNLSANDLLQKLLITSDHFCHRDSENCENREEPKKKEEEEDRDVELTLCLSLNGQFGTDPRSKKRKNFELGRSSSIPEGFVFDEQRSGGGVSNMFQLNRKRSLPVETERKRAFMEFPVPPMTKDKNRGEAAETEEREDKENGNKERKKKKNVEEDSGKENARNIIEDMPCVSTRDVGGDGKRVEGFLYWYGGNKEEVKIVCVCHGSFLSPAEFVRHGGGDVTINPLRHIVVKLPSSSL